MTERTTRFTGGPIAAEWMLRKDAIIELYLRSTLKQVMESMQHLYGFHASKRMYRTRLGKWKVYKNMRNSDRSRRKSRAIRTNSAVMPPERAALVSGELLELAYAQPFDASPDAAVDTMLGMGMNIQTTVERSGVDESVTNRNPWDLLLVNLSPTDEPQMQSFDESTGDTPSTEQSDRTLCNQGYCPSIQRSFSVELRNHEVIMCAVADCSDSRLAALVYASDSSMTPSAGFKIFWSNISNGIYLWKIAKSFPDERGRGLKALMDACENAELAVACEPFVILQKVFYILSPTNTAIYLPLRRHLLQVIAGAAFKVFGRSHPISTLCSALQQDGDSAELSMRALMRIWTSSVEKLGSSHATSYKLMDSMIVLTRRSGGIKSARGLAENALSLAMVDHGSCSDQVRTAASELAHIMTLNGEHDQALNLRLEIVECALPAGGCPRRDLTFRTDQITVHTMEDIAEYYHKHAGDLKEGCIWLMRAEEMAQRLLGEVVATLHIRDKLNALLLELEKQQVM
ncbi:hypothetical protein LTR56_002763 [Elasticomyces elasticus]|nr:hypothetical protein LTR56_002763 [Elasticomyces elasticus]KAK3666780.1 hypothetical protein LTR22_002367 [Elasticomyces elasticus]KAK4918804.1 hypothetical protein LTR49_013435 [Elasticomyces elasticus]KAK5758721.1 hypothetical protein LTS12_011115 [Elasticomyces elasticus]